MSDIVLFHPAGIGDFLMDLPILNQLIKSNSNLKQFTYVCNGINKSLVEYSGIDKKINVVYLKYPSMSISDIGPLFNIGQKAKKIFVLSGMNLKKVSYLKYLWPKKVKFYGTLENYPIECMNNMAPSKNKYQFVQGPTKCTHRIIENYNLLKTQKLLHNDNNLCLQGLSVKDNENSNNNQTSYIVVHTGLVEHSKEKTMEMAYWIHLLRGLKNRIEHEIIIIGSIYEKQNVDSILSLIDNEKINSLCGEKNLIETMQIINKAEMVLSVDSGMAHLAASIKKKLVTLFGPTDYNNISPVGTHGLIISNRLECSPCYWSDNFYKCPYNRKCLNEIDQEIIINSVLKVLSGTKLLNKKVDKCFIKKILTFDELLYKS